jgi:hypothetical protein
MNDLDVDDDLAPEPGVEGIDWVVAAMTVVAMLFIYAASASTWPWSAYAGTTLGLVVLNLAHWKVWGAPWRDGV